jgi:small-conductance mechanosensitive channel
MTVAGVTALADSSVNIRVVIKTTPGDQWAVGRAYNRLVKLRFDAAGIEIPFPQRTVWVNQVDEKAPAVKPVTTIRRDLLGKRSGSDGEE